MHIETLKAYLDMLLPQSITIKNDEVETIYNEFIMLSSKGKEWKDTPIRTSKKSIYLDIYNFIQDNQDKDLFISLWSFYTTQGKTPRRLSQYAALTNVLALDFDNVPNEYLQDTTKAFEYVQSLSPLDEEECSFFDYIEPRFIVLSGGGIHLYFELDKPLFSKEYETYKSTLEKIHRLLPQGKVDTKVKDKARVLRLPYSYNHKKEEPRLVDIEELSKMSYSISEILDTLEEFGIKDIPKETKPNKAQISPNKPIKKQEKINYTYELTEERKANIQAYMSNTNHKSKRDMYRLWFSYINKLIDFRNKNSSIIGSRNHIIMFLSRIMINNFVGQEQALTIAKDYNNKFVLPLKDKEVEDIVKDIYTREDKLFIKFKSSYSIRDFLQITPQEQDLDYSISFYKEVKEYKNTISQRNKRKREKTMELCLGIPSNMDLKYQRYFEIIENNPQASNKELSELLEVSTKQVSRLKKKYQEYKLKIKKQA